MGYGKPTGITMSIGEWIHPVPTETTAPPRFLGQRTLVQIMGSDDLAVDIMVRPFFFFDQYELFLKVLLGLRGY